MLKQWPATFANATTGGTRKLPGPKAYLTVDAGTPATARHQPSNDVVELEVPSESEDQAVDVDLVDED